MAVRILVVDDDPQVRRVCRRRLENAGYYVRCVASSSEAFECLGDYRPALVLMDITLSENDGLDGVGCVEEMRKRGYEGIACMMTGDDSLMQLTKAAIAGADAYFVKGPHGDVAIEVKALLESSDLDKACVIHPDVEGVYLRSLGFEQGQVVLLAEWARRCYPREKEFLEMTGMNQSTLSMRFKRIRDKLGCTSMSQVANLLALLSVYAARRH